MGTGEVWERGIVRKLRDPRFSGQLRRHAKPKRNF